MTAPAAPPKLPPLPDEIEEALTAYNATRDEHRREWTQETAAAHVEAAKNLHAAIARALASAAPPDPFARAAPPPVSEPTPTGSEATTTGSPGASSPSGTVASAPPTRGVPSSVRADLLATLAAAERRVDAKPPYKQSPAYRAEAAPEPRCDGCGHECVTTRLHAASGILLCAECSPRPLTDAEVVALLASAGFIPGDVGAATERIMARAKVAAAVAKARGAKP